MASKQWFILKTDHHIGPLDFDEILELYQNRRVKPDDQLWCDGMVDWSELREIEDFSQLFAPAKPAREEPIEKGPIVEEDELPPELPPLPVDIVFEQRPVADISEEISHDDLPPLPLADAAVSNKEQMNDTAQGLQSKKIRQEKIPVFEFDQEANTDSLVEADEDEVDQEDEDQEESEKDEPDEEDFWDDQLEGESIQAAPKDKKFWISAIIICILVALGSLFIFRTNKAAPVFHELRVQDAQRLQTFLKENQSQMNEKQMPFDFSLSRDGRGLMVVSPYPQEAKLYLELESIKGQVLSFEDLSLKSESTLINYQAWFRELNLESGMSLAPGNYRYKITAIPIGPIANLRRFLQKNGMAKGAIQRFESKGEILLIRENREEFDKKLSLYRERLNSIHLSPLQERIQQYQTLEQMAEQILNIYREVLPNVNKRSDLIEFEKKYAQSVGPLLQTLILEAHQKSVDLSLDQPEEALTFERLRDFGREVGELVSDMVTTTENTKNLDVVKRNRLLRQFENRVKNLRKESQKRRSSIDKELESYR